MCNQEVCRLQAAFYPYSPVCSLQQSASSLTGASATHCHTTIYSWISKNWQRKEKEKKAQTRKKALHCYKRHTYPRHRKFAEEIIFAWVVRCASSRGSVRTELKLPCQWLFRESEPKSKAIGMYCNGLYWEHMVLETLDNAAAVSRIYSSS